MIILLFSLPLLIVALFFPAIVAYLLLAYSLLNGLASRRFMADFKFTLGGINVFPLDFLFGAMAFLILIHLFKRLTGFVRPRVVSSEGKVATWMVSVYFVFLIGKLIAGYFGGVPLQALIRMFGGDAQCLYFFLPLFFIKNEGQLRALLYTVIAIAMVFPFGQLYLAASGSADIEYILQGQGTYRLGHGDFNAFLAISAIAMFAWERKVAFSALPLSGIIMLAHRSAYIGFVLSLFSLSLMKGKRLRAILTYAIAGTLVVAILMVAQETVSSKIIASSLKRIDQTFQATSTTVSRWGVIGDVFEVLNDNPLFGLGYSGAYALREKEETSAHAFNLLHSHNFVLQNLGEAGSVGLLLILLIIGYAFLCARRLSKKRGREIVGAFLFASMLFFVIFSLMNTTFETVGYLVWILIGTVFWYFNEDKLQKAKS